MAKNKIFGFKEVEVNFGLFDFDAICIIGDCNKINKYIQWKFEQPDFNIDEWSLGFTARGKFIWKDGYVPVIWIPEKPKTPRQYASLSHECVHAIFYLFKWAGISINRETEELFTHATGHLVNGILKQL